MNTPVLTKQRELKALGDSDLHLLYVEFPGVEDFQGYSEVALLSHSINVAALRAEMILRGLIPS